MHLIQEHMFSSDLQRLNSKSESLEKAEPIFDFHVIQAGAVKSSGVVPARLKEGAAKPSQSPITPLVVEKVIVKSSPSVSPKASTPTQQQQQQPKTTPATAPPVSKEFIKVPKESPPPEKVAEKSNPKPSGGSKTPSESVTKEKKKVRESPKSVEKDRDSRSGRDETLMKENIKKFLRETLKTRMKELPEEEVASFPASNTPESLAIKIEEELTNLYGSTTQAKYKNKYRSICFNLK